MAKNSKKIARTARTGRKAATSPMAKASRVVGLSAAEKTSIIATWEQPRADRIISIMETDQISYDRAIKRSRRRMRKEGYVFA